MYIWRGAKSIATIRKLVADSYVASTKGKSIRVRVSGGCLPASVLYVESYRLSVNPIMGHKFLGLHRRLPQIAKISSHERQYLYI